MSADLPAGAAGAAGSAGGDGHSEAPEAGGPAAAAAVAIPRRLSRRSFLSGALAGGAVGAAAAGGAAALLGGDGAQAVTAVSTTVPFEGAHQVGVLADPPQRATVLAFDVTAKDRAGLTALLREITAQARMLTSGTAPADGPAAPPADNGILGPRPPADGLTVTLGLGASLFDARFGLADRKPARLAPMPVFADDALDPAHSHGDLSLQLAAAHQDTVQHALRQIARATRGAMQPRWRMDGFVSPPRPAGTPRNLLGFKDGTVNPDTHDDALMDQLVWVAAGAAGEPSWTAGGSYQVIRLIRMHSEFWDRVSLDEQEKIMGRRRDTGAPMMTDDEFADFDYANDPLGVITPLTAHIRLANPRTEATAEQRILRRAWNYDHGLTSTGAVDCGLLFTCYQQDVVRQFEANQKRLAGEPLAPYLQPFGGGYFFVPPGVRGQDDFLGRGLVS